MLGRHVSRPRAWLRQHGLSIFVALTLVLMLAGTAILAPGQYRAEGVTEVGVWRWWGYETVLSLEADVFGALLLVWLTKFLFERGSPEAKDPPEDTL